MSKIMNLWYPPARYSIQNIQKNILSYCLLKVSETRIASTGFAYAHPIKNTHPILLEWVFLFFNPHNVPCRI